MKNKDMPAMPIMNESLMEVLRPNGKHRTEFESHSGLTKLEEASIKILAGMMANPEISKKIDMFDGVGKYQDEIRNILSGVAISYAETLLSELEKEND